MLGGLKLALLPRPLVGRAPVTLGDGGYTLGGGFWGGGMAVGGVPAGYTIYLPLIMRQT